MLPDLSAFDVKTQVVHGLPVAGRLHRCDDRRTALAYIARCCSSRRSSSRGGTSSERRAAAQLALVARRGRWRSRRPSRCRSARDALVSARRARDASDCSTSRSGTAAEAHRARVRRAGRRRLLDPRDSALRRRPPRSRPTARGSYELLLSAARPDDDARSVLQHRVPVRRDLPERSAARRAGPARPGDRAAREGHRGAARQVAVHARHRRSSTTGTCTTTGRRPSWFQRAAAQPDAPNWLRPLAATMLSARRSARRRAAAVAADPAVRRAVAAADRRAQPAAARRARSDRPAAGARASGAALPAGEPRHLERSGAPRRPAAASRSTRPACRTSSIPTPARVTRRRRRRTLNPMPDQPPAARDEPGHARARRASSLLGLAVGSFLNVCIHRLPRGRRSCSPARAVRVRLRAALVRQHPGRQLRHARRPLPRVPRADLDPLSDRRADHHGACSCCTTWCSAPTCSSFRGCCFACAHDRALRDRPRASAAAERRSRCPASSSGFSFSCCFRPGRCRR